MALTYVNIASQTLGSNQASVTFSSIPSTYTDLVLRVSGRSSAAVNGLFQVRFNNNSSTIYSDTYLNGNGSVVTSTRNTTGSGNTFALISGGLNVSGDTASTFSNVELYIPNYLSTTTKPFFSSVAREINTTFAILNISAQRVNLTSAVTSLVLINAGTAEFVTGSTFYLYGIKNS